MSGDPDEPSEMAEGIVGVSVYEAPEPSKKDFYAWHRPRKQFVRDRQWCVQVLRLLDDCAAFGDGDGLLKYLGLPGSDLLDIRCFYEEICKPKGLGLRFLGFNSGADPKSEQQTELNISLDEVTKLDGVDSQSQIIPDDIRRVANEESIAWSRVFKLGPFDVINLDLCDGFGTDAGGKFNDTYYNAMAHLLALQARQKTPWLLLLTTRVGNAHVDTETFALLLKRYAENLDGCADFKTESKQAFDIHRCRHRGRNSEDFPHGRL